MDKGWYLRFFIVISAVVLGWLALWPSVDRWVPAPTWVKESFDGRISPGLDIRGGLRLMYEVEVDQAIRDQRDRYADRLLGQLGERLGILEEGDADTASREQLEEVSEKARVQRLGEREIRITFESAADAEKLDRNWLEERFADLRITDSDGSVVELAIRDERLATLRETAVDQAVKTIKNRIDELQIRETTVIGRDQDIIIEIPGADESQFEHIKGIISRTASLDFLVVDDEANFVDSLTDVPDGIEVRRSSLGNEQRGAMVDTYLYAEGENARQRLQDYVDAADVPDDHVLLVGATSADGEGEVEEGAKAWRSYYLFRTTDVTGEDIEDAYVGFDPQDQQKPVVLLRFNSEGAEDFGRMTGRNVNKRMAIVLDDRVESAPFINERIGGGRAQISLGSYQAYEEIMEEARELVIVLKAGALPAPIRPANEQLIGPTLGQDSVEKGAEGALVGIGLVLIFMLFYYQVAGIVADTMVLLNVLLLFSILSGLGATLTLPGIAGIALTVGMAVDANVLINERVREELRLGKSPRSAVDQGYRRAFWSIFDSQVTTFIAGVVLFQYGTGPIKGFAVTLMIGIATSLFTGVFCSKVMLDWIVRGIRVKRLRVG